MPYPPVLSLQPVSFCFHSRSRAPVPGIQRTDLAPALNPHTDFVSPCRFEYLFNFDNTFEIHDDIEVLKRMGMSFGLESGKCSLEDLRLAKSLVPKALEGYVTGRCGAASASCSK